ncbi:hypothetical protein CCM_05202 [Cordyceps militaris CM01]|uniref:Uncharacterized protein n=1 Tax=Cordyceps militaris (strain CM01) TaxID=983644 RepID=G3JIE4_CORMM|nr:uncharacterized protein CCM_05202 [Cordyceps militaris CM01]EGX91045.1 hypothetical protein CCM_05202 [Cordyceps militaris CM01]
MIHSILARRRRSTLNWAIGQHMFYLHPVVHAAAGPTRGVGSPLLPPSSSITRHTLRQRLDASSDILME